MEDEPDAEMSELGVGAREKISAGWAVWCLRKSAKESLGRVRGGSMGVGLEGNAIAIAMQLALVHCVDGKILFRLE